MSEINNNNNTGNTARDKTSHSSVDFSHFDSKEMSEEMQQKVGNIQIKQFESGKWDGSFSINVEDEIIKSISKTFATRVNEEVLAEVNGKLKGLEHQAQQEKELLERAKEQDEKQHKYKEYLDHGYRYHPRSFSLFLFWMYLFFGVLLLFADIPLSVQLIQVGFQFESGNANYPLSKLISGDFFNVIKSNWQVFFTAAGVSLCTVFIKIMYDDYVATPFGNKVFARKMFFVTQKEKFEEEEMDKISSGERTKTFIKVLIFIITISTIVCLGFFRVNAIEQEQKIKTMNQALSATTEGSLTEEGNTGSKSLTDINSQINALHSQSDPVTATAFILITILFPVISGICFSLALNCMQNRRRRKKCTEDCKLTEAFYLLKLAEISELVKKISTNTAIQDEHQTGWVEKFTDELVFVYKYGRQVGRMAPHLIHGHKDFIIMVENWRNNAVSHKSNSNLLKLTDKSSL